MGAVKGQSRGQCAQKRHATRNVYSELSGLEDVVFHDFIKDDFISEGDGQVASGSASLSDPVTSETEVQTLEGEQNELFLESLGEYKSDAGVSAENVPAVVNIKPLKGRFIAHKFSTGWEVCVVKSVGKKKSVADQFAVKYKSEDNSLTKKLNRKDHGLDKNF